MSLPPFRNYLNPAPAAASLGMLLICAVLSGCGGTPSDQPELGLVEGVVTLDGEPLSGAMVEFHPASGRTSTGLTNEAGEYELEYTENTPGAMVGSHTVHISTERYVTDDNGETSEFPERVPAKYNSQSSLSADVTEGQNEKNFDLSSK